MTFSRYRFCRSLLTVVVAFGAAVAAFAQTSSQTTEPDWHVRYELFQMLLEQGGLIPISTMREAMENPSDTAVVMLGSSDNSFAAKEFCEAGGALLVATDRAAYYRGMCIFHHGPVIAGNRSDRYQNHSDCILVTEFNSQHPLVKGVGSLVANRTGWLERSRVGSANWEVAAKLPSNCRPVGSSGRSLLATASFSNNSDSRLIVCADQSLFINGMLWHGDNALLAINVSKLLTEGRKSLLFVVDDKPLGSYLDSPLVNTEDMIPPIPENLPENLPEPELKTMLRIANSVIKQTQEQNLLNEALANKPRGVRKASYRRAILFGLGLLALAFIIWRLSGAGAQANPPMPSRTMRTAHALVQDRKVKASEFGLAASMLAREFCQELTDSCNSAIWIRELSPQEGLRKPVVQNAADQKLLSIVLDLAVNSQTVHISQKRFLFIGKSIQQLRMLHRDGQLLKTTSV